VTSRYRRDDGAVSIELTLLAPVVIALLCFVVGLGRIADAGAQVTGAARDAARAASLQRDPDQARSVARNTAAADLTAAGIDCRNLSVVTDTTAFTAGGVVRVVVMCAADLSGLALAGLPGAKTMTATAAAPIDSYVGVGP